MLSRYEEINGVKHYLEQYSPEEFKDKWAESTDNRGGDNKWCGGSATDLDRMLKNGDTENAAKAKALSDKVTHNLQINIKRKSEVIKSNYGGCVNVPAALVNHPRAFYRRKLISKPGLRVYLGLTASAAFSAEELQNNLIAYVSFVNYLTTKYNVELYLSWPTGDDYRPTRQKRRYIPIVKIGLNPFDWGQVLAIGHSNTFRRAVFTLIQSTKLGYFGGHGYCITNCKKTLQNFMNFQPQDIFLNGMLLGKSNPETWVQKQIKKMETQ